MAFCIKWCGALHWTRWCSHLKQLISSCLATQFFGKATKVGSPPNFPRLISHLWQIPQQQYFVTLLLDPHWTCFWKHYTYYKKDTKVGSQNLATKFGFVPDCWFSMFLFHCKTSGHDAYSKVHSVQPSTCPWLSYRFLFLAHLCKSTTGLSVLWKDLDIWFSLLMLFLLNLSPRSTTGCTGKSICFRQEYLYGKGQACFGNQVKP